MAIKYILKSSKSREIMRFEFNEIYHAPDEIIVKSILERYGKKVVYNICEIGCGKGEMLNKLARTRPNSKYIGIDIESRAIKLANDHVVNGSVTFHNLHYKNFEPENRFDVIYIHSSLPYFDDLNSIALWCKNNAKKGCSVLISHVVLLRPRKYDTAQKIDNITIPDVLKAFNKNGWDTAKVETMKLTAKHRIERINFGFQLL